MQEREVVFDEAQLGDLSLVAQQLFSAGAQPGDPGYQRVLVRPPVRWGAMVLNCTLPLLACGALYALLCGFCPAPAALLASLGALLVYLLVRMKSIIITLVQLYQHFAPDHIRNRCRFEPSCSEYMIRAVQKYGACRGVCRGVGRLCRCNIHNGGYDEP